MQDNENNRLKKINFEKEAIKNSPNISSAYIDDQPEIDIEAEKRKESETVKIDGVPFSDNEIKYKISDYKKQGKINYFVNVEGAEKRKKEAARKTREEAAIAERKAKEAKAAANKKAAEKKAADAKAKAEAEKHQKAEDTRVIGELKEKAKNRKKQNRAAAREEKRRQKAEKRAAFWRSVGNFFKKIGKLFFGGWHKFITIAIIAAAIIIPSVILVNQHIEEEKVREEAEYQQKIEDLNAEINRLAEDNNGESRKRIIEIAIELDEMQQTEISAIDVMNWANYYNDEELYNKYLQLCIDRGGCGIDEEGKG